MHVLQIQIQMHNYMCEINVCTQANSEWQCNHDWHENAMYGDKIVQNSIILNT